VKDIPNILPRDYRNLQLEILCAELLRQGLSFDQLRLQLNSNFKKSYHGDIEEIVHSLSEHSFREELQVSANRNSIYDRLPEGLFHQPLGHSRVSNAAAMKDEHRRYREEEKEARKFFQPYDQEIFRYHLLVEQAEQTMSINLLRGNVNETWQHFWDLPEKLPEEANDAFVRILPWCFLISGDLALTKNALQFILAKKVEAKAYWQVKHHTHHAPFRLGNSVLSNNTILGQHYLMPALHWHFTIHDLTVAERAQYTTGRPMGLLLDRFTDIFLPIHICTTFELTPMDEATAGQDEILGYGFVL
jgi:hypothetical protein